MKIVRHACVLECHHIAGPHDYLLKVVSKDTEELETGGSLSALAVTAVDGLF